MRACPRPESVSESAIGCLFIHDTAAVPDAELKAALIAAAKDAGLEYGVRIKSIRSGTMRSPPSDMLPPVGRRQRGGGVGAVRVGDPVLAYKVYVADGHEEPIRGFEIASLELSSLKKIIAAGDRPCVFNYVGLSLGGAAGLSSIVAPPVLFEELELSKIQQEQDTPPILKAPAFR
jgi:hypothetical protein